MFRSSLYPLLLLSSWYHSCFYIYHITISHNETKEQYPSNISPTTHHRIIPTQNILSIDSILVHLPYSHATMHSNLHHKLLPSIRGPFLLTIPTTSPCPKSIVPDSLFDFICASASSQGSLWQCLDGTSCCTDTILVIINVSAVILIYPPTKLTASPCAGKNLLTCWTVHERHGHANVLHTSAVFGIDYFSLDLRHPHKIFSFRNAMALFTAYWPICMALMYRHAIMKTIQKHRYWALQFVAAGFGSGVTRILAAIYILIRLRLKSHIPIGLSEHDAVLGYCAWLGFSLTCLVTRFVSKIGMRNSKKMKVMYSVVW